MKSYNVNCIEDVFAVLNICKDINDRIESIGLSDYEREDYDFKIQEMIGDIEEFVYGEQELTDENMANSIIFSMQMWSYITGEIDEDEISEYFEGLLLTGEGSD